MTNSLSIVNTLYWLKENCELSERDVKHAIIGNEPPLSFVDAHSLIC
jgi:hypothetical protein